MNVYDSAQIAGRLVQQGYRQILSPESADLIIVNTCAIREKAEQKAFSFLGRLARLKRKKSDLIIGIGGCVAQQEGEKIFKRMPFVDIVFGTRAIGRLPALIRRIESTRCRIVDIEMTAATGRREPIAASQGPPQVSRFVTIMRGCDNFCSYCVVPYVRGRETSRKPDEIIEEIKGLVDDGTREVVLLGQNVNSYGKKEGLCSFSDLLACLNDIDGLSRIRFTTSHPKDFNADLIASFRNLEKLCRHIHLPVQSGSNKVLARMNRKYTRGLYLDKVAKLRDTCPEIAITSDIIVGFPGETEADFEESLNLIKMVEFDGLFAFIYSDRPNAAAARFADKVSESQKKKRLQILLSLQKDFTQRKNQALVGSVQEILVDGFSKKALSGNPAEGDCSGQWTGRTSTNKIVNFYHQNNPEGCGEMASGRLLRVYIEKAFFHSLRGKPVNIESTAEGLKGVGSYAA
jgi:tRNA-2-methylthio-N6-dimethylallyladenosine synthase